MMLIGVKFSSAPHQLMDKYDGILVQLTDIFSTVDDINYMRQKVYKNYGFAKVVLILECDGTKEAEDALINATTSKEDKQKEATKLRKN